MLELWTATPAIFDDAIVCWWWWCSGRWVGTARREVLIAVKGSREDVKWIEGQRGGEARTNLCGFLEAALLSDS